MLGVTECNNKSSNKLFSIYVQNEIFSPLFRSSCKNVWFSFHFVAHTFWKDEQWEEIMSDFSIFFLFFCNKNAHTLLYTRAKALDIATPITVTRSGFFKRKQYQAQHLALYRTHFARSEIATMLKRVNTITGLITKCCTNLSLTTKQRSLCRPHYKQGWKKKKKINHGKGAKSPGKVMHNSAKF